jgi:hypothetical protein
MLLRMSSYRVTVEVEAPPESPDKWMDRLTAQLTRLQGTALEAPTFSRSGSTLTIEFGNTGENEQGALESAKDLVEGVKNADGEDTRVLPPQHRDRVQVRAVRAVLNA